MDDQARRRTLETLIALASGHNPGDCWDDSRAIALVRSQFTRKEVEEFGADPQLIDHIFGERHEP